MKNEREQFLDVYETMSEESKSVFTPEQRKVIELQIGLRRLFNDSEYYKAVQQAVAEAFYEHAHEND